MRMVRPKKSDLIDAAFGTGINGSYFAPEIPKNVPVLAIDIPSGVDGDTGQISGSSMAADVTVTFAALKPGLMISPGSELAGKVEVADIGLDASRARMWLIDDGDLALLPKRPFAAHKWNSAVAVIAGSTNMSGAAHLCVLGAMRGGAGMVRLGTPGLETSRHDPRRPASPFVHFRRRRRPSLRLELGQS